MLGMLLTLLVAGIVGLVAISLILAVVGTVISVTFGVIGFLLFKVAPVLLVGYLVLKLIDRNRGHRRLSAADRKWLDGE